MKKLLTLLGSVSLLTTTAQVVVACGTSYDKRDDSGNSILIQFLQTIDGKAQITSSDILWKLINQENGPQNREKLVLDLMKMINLSILANSGEEANKKDINDESIYANYDLSTILSERWTTLEATVDRQITSEKDVYRRDKGKKWEKDWNQMLVDKYSVYQDDVDSMDKSFLENKYKSDILMSDATNSASQTLVDILINTDQTGVTWISSTNIITKYNSLSRIVNTASVEDATIANYLRADLDQIAQIRNSIESNPEKWKGTTFTNESTDAALAAEGKKIVADPKIIPSTIVNDTPINLNNFSVSDTASSRLGFLSNSQKYFLDKFYNTQAPLAISEVTIPFSTNGSFDDGVIVEDFQSDDGNDQKNNDALLKQIIEDKKDGSVWRRWMLEGKADTYPKATVKHYDKLMTLSNSTDFTQDMRSIVYDFVIGKQSQGKEIGALKTQTEIIPQLARTLNTEQFYLFNKEQGRVYYIDSTGLHIVQVDGYSYLIDEKAEKKGKKQGGIEDNKINSDTLTELNNFKKYNALTNDEKVYELQTNIEKSEYYTNLNSTIVNPYLHYLTNSSMLKGIVGAASSFDIFSEVKSWAQVSSSTSASYYWTTCVFDYFRTISKAAKETDQNTFISKFIEFEASGNNADIATKTQNWFYGAVSTKQSSIVNKPGQLFSESSLTWTDEIKAKTTASGYPKKTFEDAEYIKTITSLANKFFWMPDDYDAATSSSLKVNSINSTITNEVFFNYDLVTKNITNSYREFEKGGSQ